MLANQQRLRAMFTLRDFVDSGGLVSYGPNLLAQYRHAAVFVDKILKGAKPADLPVETPTTFELVVNQRTAKLMDLKVPAALLLRAQEVIE